MGPAHAEVDEFPFVAEGHLPGAVDPGEASGEQGTPPMLRDGAVGRVQSGSLGPCPESVKGEVCHERVDQSWQLGRSTAEPQ